MTNYSPFESESFLPIFKRLYVLRLQHVLDSHLLMASG